MAIRYYSDVTKQYYNSEKECLEAEFKIHEQKNRERIQRERAEAAEKERKEKLSAERKARAKEIEDARKEMVAAQKKYRDLVSTFAKDYGSYHFSSNSVEDIPTLFNFISDWL